LFTRSDGNVYLSTNGKPEEINFFKELTGNKQVPFKKSLLVPP
jgi:hypothetical protein